MDGIDGKSTGVEGQFCFSHTSPYRPGSQRQTPSLQTPCAEQVWPSSFFKQSKCKQYLPKMYNMIIIKIIKKKKKKKRKKKEKQIGTLIKSKQVLLYQ